MASSQHSMADFGPLQLAQHSVPVGPSCGTISTLILFHIFINLGHFFMENKKNRTKHVKQSLLPLLHFSPVGTFSSIFLQCVLI